MKWWINGIIIIIVFVLFIPTFIVKGCSGKNEHTDKSILPREGDDNQPIIIKNDKDDPIISLYDHVKKTIIKLPLEEYIVGVVAAEMPASFDIEALKAQSVAARTLVVQKMREFGGRGCTKYEDADACSFYGHCQAWISDEQRHKNWGESYNENTNKIVQAVSETRGKILTYNGQPIEVFFYSTSNGKTEEAQEVFSKALPYYKVVDSEGEEDAPKYSSTFSFSNKEFVDIFKKQYPKANLTTNNISSQVKILSYTNSDRVKEISIGGIKLKGKDFRYLYGINSADFKFEFLKGQVNIYTTGYGHGVGMSQVGADRMGKNGTNYIDILKHYYVGVDIDQKY